MTTNSTTKQTIAATLGMVTTAATAVSSIFDTVGDGVGMLNRAVGTAAEKQTLTSDYEMAMFEDQLLNNVAIEQTRQNLEINRFLDENPANREAFSRVYGDLQTAVAARRAQRSGNANNTRSTIGIPA